MMKGKIVRIMVYPAKGEKGIQAEIVQLKKDLGIEGDFHSTGGDKQISLLSIESRNWIDNAAEKGLCFSRFKENITTEGITLENLRAGHKLMARKTMLEITGESKHCHEECPLFRKGDLCHLSGQSLFAKVIHSGTLRVGDEVEGD